MQISPEEDGGGGEEDGGLQSRSRNKRRRAPFFDTGVRMSTEHPRRHRLGLSDEQLAVLRQAVDASLRVPGAMTVARHHGRRRALKQLQGRTKLVKRGSRDSVLKLRAMGEHAFKKKRPSGPSNWPRTPEERLRVKARTEERKAAGLPPWKQGDQEVWNEAGFYAEAARYNPTDEVRDVEQSSITVPPPTVTVKGQADLKYKWWVMLHIGAPFGL